MDESIPKAVSKLMIDHVMDEARHHAFFKNLIWKFHRMNPHGLRRALSAIPASIMAFIQPDREAVKIGLMQVGLNRDEALQIIDETYSLSSVQEYARHSSRDLVAFMLNNEICDDLHLRDELENHCLIGE